MKENNIRNEKERKGTVLSVVAVLVLIALVFGVTYAVFTFTGTGQKTNSISSGTITVLYSEGDAISITDAQPITDAVGKVLPATQASGASGTIVQGYFDFNVNATVAGTTSINYEVYATPDAGNTLSADYVKVYLTDGQSSETARTGYTGTVPVFSGLTAATSTGATAGSKKLYDGTFTSNGTLNQTDYFRLRIWVADTYTVTDQVQTFKLKVHVKADQTAAQ